MKYKNFGIKTHKHRFYIILSVFVTIALIASICVMTILWNFLEEYEKATPTAALNSYIDLVEAGGFDKICEDNSFAETEFTSKDDYIRFLTEKYSHDLSEATFVKIMTQDQAPDKQIFEIHANNILVDTVTLTKNESNGSFAVHPAAPPYLAPITVVAPADATVFVNGTALNEKHIISKNAEAAEFKGIGKSFEIPTAIEYSAKGFLQPPVVTAEVNEGSHCEIEVNESNYTVFVYAAEQLQAELQAVATNAAKTYAAFITRDATLADIQKQLLPDTSFYDTISHFDNNWYNSHEGFSYRNIKSEQVRQYSDIAFCVEVTFDYVIRRQGKDFISPSTYAVSMIMKNGKALVVNMQPK